MKLRRAYAAVATTAVLAPVALLAAPAAHAASGSISASGSTARTLTTDTPSSTDGPATTPEQGEGTTPSPSPGTSETAAGGSGTEQEQEPAPGKPGGTDEKPDAEEGADTEKDAGEQEDGAAKQPGDKGQGEDREKPGEEADEPEECADLPAEDPDLTTTLHGLPSKVVAGSGFHTFSYRVANSSDRAYQRVDFGVLAGTVHGAGLEETGKYLTLQFRNPDTGAWERVSTDDRDEDAGYIGFTDVRAHETISLDLRLSVAADAPAGMGFAISVGAYVDEDGGCFLSAGDYYEFAVLKAGERPGKVPGAKPQDGRKPQGGAKPLPAKKPVGDREINPVGQLAQTGSSSALPVLGLAGAAAVAVGAGAVFTVRRRKTDGAQA